ncbi:MAG TPA: alpha/beta fold hydrolase [Verrucomicrobiae bacterium]|nr:alpha/beta fold hydrolase [Verrucomicrobiae bacterium]
MRARTILIPLLAIAACAPQIPGGDAMAHVNGIDLHYHVEGSGPVLIVQPGGPGFEWKYLRLPLVERFATVVYVDPRGSGGSSRPEGAESYRMDRMVDDLDALREHLGLARFTLMGHSHGGMVAQLYAIRHQASLRKLILCATVASAGGDWSAEVGAHAKERSGEAWYPEASAELFGGGRAASDDDARARFKKIAPFYFYKWEPFRDETLRMLDALSINPVPQATFAELDAPSFDTREGLKALRVPTLILAGRHDFACTPERAAEMNGLMPNSRLVVFENSGHFLYQEEAEGFAQAIRGFLSED